MGVENPEWLPVGWKVCVKVRKSGKKDKYYVNPSKGLKFNSKPEVLRYLKNSKKQQKPKNPNEVDIEKTVPENLPPGWTKEIKVTKKGGKTRRDPNYIDPVSGRHFRSMPEVFQYLESKDGLEKAKPEPDEKDHSRYSSTGAKRKRSIHKIASSTLTKQESIKSGAEFASGVKGAKMNNVIVSKDTCLEQKEEDDSLAIELSDKLKLVNGMEQFPDKTIEITKLANNKADKSVDGDQILESGSKVMSTLKGKVRDEVGRRQSKRLADGKLKDDIIVHGSLKSGSKDDAVKNVNINGEGCKQENPPRLSESKYSNSKWTSNSPRRTSKRLAQIEVDPPLDLEVKTSKKSRPSDEPKIHPTKKLKGLAQIEVDPSLDLEVKTSKKSRPSDEPKIHPTEKLKRLAQIEVDPPLDLEVKTSKKSRPSDEPRIHPTEKFKRLAQIEVDPPLDLEVKTSKKSRPSDEPRTHPTEKFERLAQIEVDPPLDLDVKTSKKSRPSGEPKVHPTKNLAKSSKPNEPTKRRTANPPNSKKQNPVSSPRENLSILEEDKSANVNSIEDKRPEKQHINASLNDILMDPCIEFAIKTLTGAIPIEDLKKVGDNSVASSRALPYQTTFEFGPNIKPCGDIWADPCFEFAVKTLTGDGPTDSLPKFRLDNFYPSNSSLSQFDDVNKSYVRQESVRDCTPMNGSSKNFGLHR